MQMENEMYRNAIDWVTEAGEIIKERIHQTLDIKLKSSHSDLVTAVDREIEDLLRKQNIAALSAS